MARESTHAPPGLQVLGYGRRRTKGASASHRRLGILDGYEVSPTPTGMSYAGAPPTS
jgi:hypothetical protein